MQELTKEEIETINKIINWHELSTTLTGNKNQISRTRIGKKYQKPIDELRKLIYYWKGYIERNNFKKQITKHEQKTNNNRTTRKPKRQTNTR